MNDDKSKAWTGLAIAATNFAADGLSQSKAKILSAAACVWAAANGYTKPGEARVASGKRSGVVLPFGRQKGVAIEDADEENLRWVLGRVLESLDDPDKERFRAKNSELVDAIEKELETR